jgi:hypothetical protein
MNNRVLDELGNAVGRSKPATDATRDAHDAAVAADFEANGIVLGLEVGRR